MTRASVCERLGPADALEFPLLEDAEQLGLRRSGQLADLVEEDRAAGGALEPAGPLAVGAGEGASLVAEELALDQALGQRAAVDPDERAARCAREWRCSAAATSSLPVPLSPTIRTGSSVAAARPIALKTSRIAALWPTSSGSVVGASVAVLGILLAVAEGADLGGEGTLAQGPLQGQQDLVEVERLGQVVVGPPAHRLDGGGRAAEGGDDDHGQVGQRRARAAGAPPGRRGRASSGRAGPRRGPRRGSGPAPGRRRPPRASRSPRPGAAGRGCGGSSGRRRRPGSVQARPWWTLVSASRRPAATG